MIDFVILRCLFTLKRILSRNGLPRYGLVRSLGKLSAFELLEIKTTLREIETALSETRPPYLKSRFCKVEDNYQLNE